ncbi:MAG: GNAT family N-acetyltransferase [Saprospiraceae bacterium]|nr:GNAT family N-acetyltransferase [Saprospiraceae bacterium]
MMFKIRKIQPDDCLEWHALRLQLWAEDEDESDLLENTFEYFKNPKKQQVFIAENKEGNLIGFIEANIREYAEGCDTDNVGFIEGWFVLPDYRRQNIGKKLVETAENWAKQQGCTEMASDTHIHNELSIDAHTKLGYEEVERIICFRKKL